MTTNETKWSAVKRFFSMLKLDNRDITYVYIYAIFAGLITLSLPLGIQAIIGLIVGGSLSTSLLILVTVVTVGTALTGFLTVMQITVTETLQRRIFARSAFEFAYRIPKLNLEKMLKDYPPELVNRFFDTLTLQKGVPKLLMDFSTAGLNIVFGLLLISFYHPFFVFFGIILLFLLVIIIRITGPGGLKTSLNESKYKYQVVYWLEEMARALTTFKMAGDDKLPLRQTDDLVSNYLDNRKAHFRILLMQYGNIVAFKTIITLGLLLLGSSLVIDNSINIGQFVAAEIVVLQIMSSAEKLILSMETIYDVLTAVEKIGAVVDLPLERRDGIDYEEIDNDKGLNVKLEKVCFKFEDSNKNTVKDIHLHMKPGEVLNIAGYNGSGKATLSQLISGLYNHYQGQISFNGIPLKSLNKSSLRRHIGNYTQLSDIFRGSILDNINLGYDDVDLKQVLWAAEKAGLNQHLRDLPDGFDTELKPGGTNIPGSIRAKILLARAIAARPKLIVFEEFFEKLEPAEQLRIIRFLTRENHEWTLVIVSNNPLIAQHCDRTVIMQEGRIVEEGRYDQIQGSPHFGPVFKNDISELFSL